MGCTGSRFDEMPVTGHPHGIKVLPGSERRIKFRYMMRDLTVLKLREKFFSFSGDDCTIKDMDGKDWFKIEGEAMSINSKRTMTDTSGSEVAGYRKKLLSLHATAYVTVELNGQTLVFATIRKQSMMQLESSANIYIHEPPLLLEDVSTEGLDADIHVEGDIISKKYDFMMGDMENNPYKIAQVIRKFKMIAENNSYFLNVGPKVDVAFICMCAFAIDELFSDD